MKANIDDVERSMKIKAVKTDKLVGEMITRIVSNPKLFEDCQANALEVKKRRKMMTVKLRPYTPSINVNLGFSPVRLIKDKVKDLLTLRDKIETETVTKQFIMTNKKLINDKFVTFNIIK